MKNELAQAVRQLCLAFPETEELISHGMPNYRVRGKKIFAMFAVNHHGDGRIALWLNTPAQVQDAYVDAEPKHFFVPPYVGPGGWLGVRLDTGLAWKRVAPIVRVAYERVSAGETGESTEENTFGTRAQAADYRRGHRSQKHSTWQTDSGQPAQDLPRPAGNLRERTIRPPRLARRQEGFRPGEES